MKNELPGNVIFYLVAVVFGWNVNDYQNVFVSTKFWTFQINNEVCINIVNEIHKTNLRKENINFLYV